MSDSREIFALRKKGLLEEALELARQHTKEDTQDRWVIRAYGWTLYSLIKKSYKAKDATTALEYLEEFKDLKIAEDDELLLQQVTRYEIKLLGSEEQLAAYLQAARDRIRDFPGDVDALIDYGWRLDVGIHHAYKTKNMEIVAILFKELQAVGTQVPGDDPLQEQIGRCRILAQPDAVDSLIARAKEASRADKVDESLALYRKIVNERPESTDMITGFGWEVSKKLKSLDPEEQADRETALALSIEYVGIQSQVEKPGRLHSAVLRQLSRFPESDPAFLACLRSCLSDAFSEEDYARYKPEGGDKEYDSLVEKLIKAIYHGAKKLAQGGKPSGGIVKGEDTPEDTIGWAAAFVGTYYQRFPDQEWFPYYYGTLLLLSKDTERARPFILETVRKKPTESWAWRSLSATYPPEQIDHKIACLCKALDCPTQNPAYLVNARLELAKLLKTAKHFAEARVEVDTIIHIRKANRWKVSPDLLAHTQESWYLGAPELPDNKAFYKTKIPEAIRLLDEGADWLEAIVTGMSPKAEGRAGKIYLSYRAGSEVHEVSVNAGRHEMLTDAAKGSPVKIIVESRKGRKTVVLADLREGEPWDVLPLDVGLVTHVNQERGLTSVALGKSTFCLVHHDRFPEVLGYKAGDALGLRSRRGTPGERPIPLSVEPTTSKPEADFARSFRGKIRISKTPKGLFGFVHDVYISQGFLKELDIKKTDVEVCGQAVCEWNNRKSEYTWKAVSINLPIPD
jgi:tetratricopeptide (TPR) repeat protein